MQVHMLEHSSDDPGTSVYCLMHTTQCEFYHLLIICLLPRELSCLGSSVGRRWPRNPVVTGSKSHPRQV